MKLTTVPFALWVFLMLCSLQSKSQVSPVLIANGVANNNCTPVGDPIPSGCSADLHKIVARSANAENLSSWIMPETCWGWIGTNGTPYYDTLIPPPTTQVNCVRPYNRCYTHYCPNKYCDLIKTFLQLKASLIVRAANLYGKEDQFFPGSDYYNSVRQVVIDINAAYDCFGLRRPVIQGGGAVETCDPKVKYITIPPTVIEAFRYDPGFESGYYLNPNGTAKASLKFNHSRIIYEPYIGFPYANTPDIRKIEARMWFYYFSKLFIDLGYKSLHLGQLDRWGHIDADYNNYYYTQNILTKIRNYAISKGTFVLLTEENFKGLRAPGSNMFLFDYDSRALRPREISNPQVCADYGCSNSAQNYIAGSPCDWGINRAVIDPCVIYHGDNTYGGISPVNNCYTPYLPYNTYFDFDDGVDSLHLNQATNGCISDQEGSTWGYDDSRWFGREITMGCRDYWIGDAIRRMRGYHNGFGFMIAPVLLPLPDALIRSKWQEGINPTGDGWYLLSDEPTVKSTVWNAWLPNSYVGIGVYKQCVDFQGFCGFPPKLLRKNKYIFTVAGADNTTVYTWHMQYPDGSWLPYSYGRERVFYPPYSGYYTIYLRQDNLGGYSGTPYESVKTISYRIYLYKQCCGNSVRARGEEPPPYDEDYEGPLTDFEENTDFAAYDSYIENNEMYYLPDDSLGGGDSPEFLARSGTNSLPVNRALQNSPSLEIYPNPADNILYIRSRYGFDRMVDLKILDMSGRTIKMVQNVRISDMPADIPLSGMAPGTYFIHVMNESDLFSEYLMFIKL